MMNLSKLSNLNDTEDPYSRDPIVECSVLTHIGVYCTVLLILSIIFNITLIWILIKHRRQLLDNANILILFLAILNFIGSITELPMVGTAAFMCKFIFGKIGCQIEAMIMYLVGCSSIYILMFISYTRYRTVSDPLNYKAHSKVQTAIACVVSISIGIFWSSAPVIGWSHYSLEGALISCSIEWHERTASVMSYNILIALFVYLLPLGIFCFTSARVYYLMRVSREKFAYLLTQAESRKKIQLEFRLAVRSAILIFGFLLSWTPYALVCLYRAFFDADGVSPLGATLPGFFAKSSFIWPALFSLLGNKEIRQKICGYDLIIREKNRSSISSNKSTPLETLAPEL